MAAVREFYIARCEDLIATARREGRALTTEESAEFDRLTTDLERLSADGPAPDSTEGTPRTAAPVKGAATTMQRYEELIEQRAGLVTENDDLIEAVNGAGRDLTPEELADVRRRQTQIERLDEQISVMSLAREQSKRDLANRSHSAIGSGAYVSPNRSTGAPHAAERVNWGHRYGVRLVTNKDGLVTFGGPRNAFDLALGDFLGAVVQAGSPQGYVDPRLFRAGPSGGSTGVPSDGGFMVGSDFSNALLEMAFQESVLAQRCRVFEIGANSDKLEAPYISETSRATGSRWGGVRVYRRAEADTVTASKPTLEKFELELEDLMGIAYMTGRMSQDAAVMGQVYRDSFIAEFVFKLEDEIVRGSGVGECLGILNAGALISVSAESGQLADTVEALNVINMYARLNPRNRAGAVWLINTEVEAQLQQLQIGIGTGGQLVYMPPGGLSGAPYGTLYGKPVIAIEHAEELGTVGDIMLVDLSDYILIRKGGVEEAESMHVRFLYDEKALRWMQRINGAPKTRTPLTPYQGNNTLSPYVALATRS